MPLLKKERGKGADSEKNNNFAKRLLVLFPDLAFGTKCINIISNVMKSIERREVARGETVDIRSGSSCPADVLTDKCGRHDRNGKQMEKPRKRVFVDMDGVLVDFQSGLDLQDKETLKAYEGRLDEIPGLFADMQPMPGAIEAMHELQKHFDLYILSTAPWKNPSAWSDKVKWVTRYLDDVFHKRMIITHCKNLCKGDYLIDDRGKNGTQEFEGEWILFGGSSFPNWSTVVNYLYEKNGIE